MYKNKYLYKLARPAMSKEVQRTQRAGPPWTGAAHRPRLALPRESQDTVPESGEQADSRPLADCKEHQVGRGYDLRYKGGKFSRAKKDDPEKYLMVHPLGNHHEISPTQNEWKTWGGCFLLKNFILSKTATLMDFANYIPSICF